MKLDTKNLLGKAAYLLYESTRGDLRELGFLHSRICTARLSDLGWQDVSALLNEGAQELRKFLPCDFIITQFRDLANQAKEAGDRFSAQEARAAKEHSEDLGELITSAL